jgi:hypothetical protein
MRKKKKTTKKDSKILLKRPHDIAKTIHQADTGRAFSINGICVKSEKLDQARSSR